MMKSWLTEYQIIELKIKKADLINKMALCIKKISSFSIDKTITFFSLIL